MNKRAYNIELEKAKTKIFEAEVIMSDLIKDDEVPLNIKEVLTRVIQNNTPKIMWEITELYIEDVKKRKIKARGASYFSK